MTQLARRIGKKRQTLVRRQMGRSAVRGWGPLIIAVAALGSVVAGPTIWALIFFLTIAGVLLIISLIGAPLGIAFL